MSCTIFLLKSTFEFMTLIHVISFALKVLSGSEWGNLLLWEGGLIKVELCRPGHKNCHNGPINQLILDEGEVITVGSDGYIRVRVFVFFFKISVLNVQK